MRVLVADSEQLPLTDGSFDAIVMLGVIAYSPQPRALIADTHRVLKPGGLLIISSVTRRALLRNFSRSILGWNKTRAARNQGSGDEAAASHVKSAKNTRAYRPRELDCVVRTCEFKKLASFGIDYGRLSYSDRKLLSDRASIALSRSLSRIARLPPFEFMQDHARLYVGCFEKHGGGSRTEKRK